MKNMKSKPKNKEIKLNLGCGIGLIAGYVNVDKFIDYDELIKGFKTKEGPLKHAYVEKGAEYVKADILHLPFKDEYADTVELHEVIEHFAMADVIPALKEIRRVMKTGGRLKLSTNNFDSLAVEWLNMVRSPSLNFEEFKGIAEEIYGNQQGEGEFHRCPMNLSFLQYCLGGAGFTQATYKLFRRNDPIPEDLGIVSHLGKNMYFRAETIYLEVDK